MSLFKTIAQGGQIWAHRMRMVKQVFRIAILLSTVSGATFFAIEMAKSPLVYYQSIWYFIKANTLEAESDTVTVSSHYWYHNRHFSTANKSIQVPRVALIYRSKKEMLDLLPIAKKSGSLSGYLSIVLFALSNIYFLLRGISSKKKHHLSGISTSSPRKLNWKLKLTRRCSDIKLGSVHMLKDSETQHLLISGTTGTGKTTCLKQLLSQIRKRGDRAVIVDTTGGFLSNFYKPESDILFSPYDERSAPWHPWCECHQDYHFEQFVNNLIPNNKSSKDVFFEEAGRAVLSSALKKSKAKGQLDIEAFINFLLRESMEDIFSELQDTDAAIYLDPKGERTTVSIRATIANIVRYLRPLKTTSTPFSIRDWVQSEKHDSSWMFLSCTTEQRQALTPLISVWLSTAVNALKAKDPNSCNEKIWFIIDELPSLQKLEVLEESLAELRKYGGCIVLATQDLSQIDKQYGVHSTKTIIDLCGTKVCFRQSDAEIARRISTLFGEKEIKETQEGLSYGAHEMRDGVNLSNIERVKPTVSASKILALDNLEAFIKLPGNLPAIKTQFKY